VSRLTIVLKNLQLLPAQQKLHKSLGKEEKYKEETKQEILEHVEDVRYAHN
jgi:hypothetical protein